MPRSSVLNWNKFYIQETVSESWDNMLRIPQAVMWLTVEAQESLEAILWQGIITAIYNRLRAGYLRDLARPSGDRIIIHFPAPYL